MIAACCFTSGSGRAASRISRRPRYPVLLKRGRPFHLVHQRLRDRHHVLADRLAPLRTRSCEGGRRRHDAADAPRRDACLASEERDQFGSAAKRERSEVAGDPLAGDSFD
jgi:hypothetical protein